MTANSLAGKNVVIIGGTAGIGLATAQAASAAGARVWVAGRCVGQRYRILDQSYPRHFN